MEEIETKKMNEVKVKFRPFNIKSEIHMGLGNRHKKNIFLCQNLTPKHFQNENKCIYNVHIYYLFYKMFCF